MSNSSSGGTSFVGVLLIVAYLPDKQGNRLRTSKFAVGEKVMYCCLAAEVTQIQWKDDKFTYSLSSNSFPDNISEESLIVWTEPKFKVGDVVYYKSKNQRSDETCKWVVVNNVYFKCVVIEQKSAGLSACMRESDLRLWVETELTHCLQDGSDKWSTGGSEGWKKEWYNDIKFIGNINGHDTFVVNGKCLFRGKKGDDL